MYQSQETSSNPTSKYVYFAARKLYETRSTTFWSYYKMPVCILLGHMENITERNLKDGLLQRWIWRQTVWGSERWKEARNFCQNLCVRLEFTFLTQSQIHPDKYNQRELRFKEILYTSGSKKVWQERFPEHPFKCLDSFVYSSFDVSTLIWQLCHTICCHLLHTNKKNKYTSNDRETWRTVDTEVIWGELEVIWGGDNSDSASTQPRSLQSD